MKKGVAALAPEQILSVWFGEDPAQPLQHAERWFLKEPAFDQWLTEEFEPHIRRAISGTYDHWKETPRGALAFIILLDQFSRNIYRDTPASFAQDGAALTVCRQGLENGFEARLAPMERSFFYMPLMHGESLELQRLSVQNFAALAKQQDQDAALRESLEKNHGYAVDHCKVIEKFGRFPHRNQILGRPSSPGELEYLANPEAGF